MEDPEAESIPPEKVAERQTMKDRIEGILADKEKYESVRADFLYTFDKLGLNESEAEGLCDAIFLELQSAKSLEDIESNVLRIFESTTPVAHPQGENLVEILHKQMTHRAEIIAAQVAPYLQEIEGSVMDYGAGDGQVTQLLHNNLGLHIEGVDIRSYRAPGVQVPIALFDGEHVDVTDHAFEATVLTNVLHHEKDNERILQEIDRITSKRLIILETVPDGENEEAMEKDKDRTFMNDYLYNRLFHSADVPVPGAFETPKRWVERLRDHGWKLVPQGEEDLGFDQPTIRDRHYIMVFERI